MSRQYVISLMLFEKGNPRGLAANAEVDEQTALREPVENIARDMFIPSFHQLRAQLESRILEAMSAQRTKDGDS